MSNRLQKVLNLAHRGASGHAPENTMKAFHVAEQLGADGFELDVQLTKDGVPVVIHDETLGRTTNGHGLVVTHTLEEIRRLDAGSWYGRGFAGEPIPTLEEVLREFGERMVINIELKNSYVPMLQLEEKVIDLVRRYQMESQAILSSFHHGSMQRVHELAPDIETALLYDCVIVGAEEYARRLGATGLHPFYGTVKKELVQEAHQQGLAVRVWTVNEVADMKQMVDIGVDAIITNYPERLRDLLI